MSETLVDISLTASSVVAHSADDAQHVLARLRLLRQQKPASTALSVGQPLAPSNKLATVDSAPATQAKLSPEPSTSAALHRRLNDWLKAPRHQQRLQLLGGGQRQHSVKALPGANIGPGLQLIERRIQLDTLPDRLYFAADTPGIPPHALLAIDTETTGLSGGTGTRAFLIGVAAIEGKALCLRQWLLTGLAGEPAMLEQFRQSLITDCHLLSYNGKSYDLPLLRTRFRLHRLDGPSEDLHHIDLLHLVRRRYRGRWTDCRLTTVERQLLSIVRDDDLPGSEAPAAFRRWLQAGDASNLIRVVKHNAQDLISLVQLALRLGNIDPDRFHLASQRA